MQTSHQVPFIDPSRYFLQKLEVFQAEQRAILKTGQVIAATHTVAAEQQIGHYLQADVALVGSCTEALSLSLLSLELKKGAKVLLPAYSFAATYNSVVLLGLTPVFVDVTPAGTGYDQSHLQEVLKAHPDIAAMVVVHLFGHPFEMDDIDKICIEKDLPLIEDCAQFFAPIRQNTAVKKHFFCYSFDPTKNFHSIERLGAVASPHAEDVQKIRSLRSHGVSLNRGLGRFQSLGMNSRPSEMAAAFIKIAFADHKEREQKRWGAVQKYIHFCEANGIHYIAPVAGKSTWNKFVVLVENPDYFLNPQIQKKVQFRRHYNYILPEFIKNQDLSLFPHALKLKSCALTWPLFAEMSALEVEKTLDTFEKGLENNH